MRTVIIGGPKAGKTTRSELIGGRVLHTDDLMHLDWSDASEQASRWFDEEYDVIEGVAAVRALRKWLRRNRIGKPCDRVLYLTRAHQTLNRGQASMATSIGTVFAEIRQELVVRGVGLEWE